MELKKYENFGINSFAKERSKSEYQRYDELRQDHKNFGLRKG